MPVCVHLVGDGILWSRLCDRLGEEDKGELFERGLDSLHLPRGAQGKSDVKNTNTLTSKYICTIQRYLCSRPNNTFLGLCQTFHEFVSQIMLCRLLESERNRP